MSSDPVTFSRRAVVIVVLAALLAGLTAKTFLFPAGRTSAPHPAPLAALSGPGPVRVEAPGVPVGFARTKSGALAAAVAYVQLGNLVLSLDSASASEVLRRVTSRVAGDAFVSNELDGFSQLRDALARGDGPVHLRVGVVATRVDAYAPDRARVLLWRVVVLSRDGMTNAGEQWATVTYDVVWEDGDWKIWSETDVPGPSPASSDSRFATPRDLDASLLGFSAFPGAG